MNASVQGSLYAALIFLAATGHSQDADDPLGQAPLSPPEIREIKQRSARLLVDLKPRESPPSVPYEHGPEQPVAQMKSEEGVVLWGNLFCPEETVALAQLAAPKDEEDYNDLGPHYCCVFAWEEGRWEFRQFLGNVNEMTVHHRKDNPSAFLQGSRKTGKYEGDHLSWYYDRTTGQLLPTDFEDWGPFSLAGDYLISRDGFRRLSHDENHWVYSYQHGRKGKLLGYLHENDRGYFDVGCREPKTGQMQRWHFQPEKEDENRFQIAVQVGTDEIDADGGGSSGANLASGEAIPEKPDDVSSAEDFFAFLTGLDPLLLEGKWLDKLPVISAPKRLPYRVTGDPAVVSRFQ